MLHPHAHIHTHPQMRSHLSLSACFVLFVAYFSGLLTKYFIHFIFSFFRWLAAILEVVCVGLHCPALTAKAARHTHKCLWQQLPTSSSTSPVLNNARVLHNLCFLAGRIEKYIQTNIRGQCEELAVTTIMLAKISQYLSRDFPICARYLRSRLCHLSNRYLHRRPTPS